MRVRLAPSMRGYQRSWITGDVMAGITLLVIAVPEQLATSRLAGMPAATALWAFVAATIAFFLFGSSKTVSVGADSTIAPLFAAAVAHLAVTGSPKAIALTSLTALVTGAIVLAIGLLRLGWIADLLSVPIITGFMVGVAAIITIHQLPDLLGAGSAGGSTVHRLDTLFRDLHSTKGWPLAIGLTVLAIMLVCEKIDRRIPAALIGLVGSTLLVSAADLGHRGVALLGPVATGLPKVGVPSVSWGDIGSVLPVSLTVALVCLAQTAATVRGFSSDEDASEMNHDFVALGAGNILSGFAGAFAVDACPARTSVVSNARGKTQAACLLAALVIAVASPAANELRRVPLATLAAILIFIASRLVRAPVLKAIARFSKVELGLAAVTAVVVAFVGVEQGIALAVILAIFDRARHSARPRMAELGRVPGTTSWAPLHTSEQLETVPGVRVVLFAGPLYFANAGEFRARFDALVKEPDLPHAIVLDAASMGDIDYTGATTLKAVVEELNERKIEIVVARGGRTVTDNLKQGGIFDLLGNPRIFETVDEAVRSVAGEGAVAPAPAPETPVTGAPDEHR
ncbi:MAG: SulP family inorganic anion transporter [Acidimicrobiales bacterium]